MSNIKVAFNEINKNNIDKIKSMSKIFSRKKFSF